MKIMKKKLLALGLAGAALFVSHEAKATDLEITAKATIAQPIKLTKDTDNVFGTTHGDLSFGLITPGATSQPFRISPVGNGSPEWVPITNTGAVWNLNGVGPAVLKIEGLPDTECTVTSDTDVIDLQNGSDPTKTLSLRLEIADLVATLNSSGESLVAIGGVLTVPSDATVGSYTGTFTVSVDYQ